MGNESPSANDDAEDGTDDEDEVPTISYRGEISREEWAEFKSNVPHSKTLMGVVNELIRNYNESMRSSKSDDSENNNI